jgi:hypothetical protein
MSVTEPHDGYAGANLIALIDRDEDRRERLKLPSRPQPVGVLRELEERRLVAELILRRSIPRAAEVLPSSMTRTSSPWREPHP